MQTLAAETNGIPLLGAHAIVKQGPDFDTLSQAVGRAVAAYVLAHATTAKLIDISLSGGGAGNTFMATLMVAPVVGTPAEERLANLDFHWFTAPDFNTLAGKINAFLAVAAAGDSLYAWDVACAGDGAVWIAVLVAWQPGA